MSASITDCQQDCLIGHIHLLWGYILLQVDKHEAVLWKIDVKEINSLLPQSYRDLLEEENAYLFTTDMIEKAARTLNEYDNDIVDTAMVLLEPPSIDQRIVNQYSYFSIVPK